MKVNRLFIALIISLITSLYADKQIYNNYYYQQPSKFEFIKSMPKDYKDYYKIITTKNYLPELLTVALSTGLLVAVDEKLIIEAKIMGRKLNLSNDDKTKTFFRLFGQPIRFPTDLGSTLYFIGDGWTHIGISSSFLLYGKLFNDNRALQTASQIAESMATAGLLTQIIKHITGRTSPFRSEDGHSDKWTLFPNQIEYHKNVSAYDAFPSGHMAVTMATVTVVAENYSEYNFIWPIGWGAMTLLGFQMMNNGVHWISDYPLSLSMGYHLGKIAVKNGREQLNNTNNSFNIIPYISPNKFIGMSLIYNFK